MGDLVNLRLARKRKARSQAESEAARNRAAFGRKRSEKTLDRLEQEREQRQLDGHRLAPPDDGA